MAMPAGIPGDAFLETPEFKQALDLISGKWNLRIVGLLQHGPRRHADLLHLVDGISQKMLTQTLRRLQADGLVERTVVSAKPLRVTYSLTAAGHTFGPVLRELRRWVGRGMIRTCGCAVPEGRPPPGRPP